jgi:outer membrane biosynthesis protein TonB
VVGEKEMGSFGMNPVGMGGNNPYMLNYNTFSVGTTYANGPSQMQGPFGMQGMGPQQNPMMPNGGMNNYGALPQDGSNSLMETMQLVMTTMAIMLLELFTQKTGKDTPNLDQMLGESLGIDLNGEESLDKPGKGGPKSHKPEDIDKIDKHDKTNKHDKTHKHDKPKKKPETDPFSGEEVAVA